MRNNEKYCAQRPVRWAALGIAAVMSAGLRAWNVEFEGWNLHLGNLEARERGAKFERKARRRQGGEVARWSPERPNKNLHDKYNILILKLLE